MRSCFWPLDGKEGGFAGGGCVGIGTSLWEGLRSVTVEERGGEAGSLEIYMLVSDILRNNIDHEGLGIEWRGSYVQNSEEWYSSHSFLLLDF